jgi:hypothetical protein
MRSADDRIGGNSRGYLSLESREVKAAVAIALEAWTYDNIT